MRAMNWAGLFLACALTAGAQSVPQSFNYQGVLRGGSGELLSAGSKNVEFRLYSAPTKGTALWGRMYQVMLDTNGLFNVELSNETGTALVDTNLTSVVSGQHPLYLGITVQDSGEEISPRQQLLSVPFALMAGNVQEACGAFTVQGELTAKDDLHVTGGADVSGETSLQNLTVKGNGTLNNGLTVLGTATLNSGLTVLSMANLSNGVAVTGSATVSQNLTVQGNATLGNVTLFSSKAPTTQSNSPMSLTTKNTKYSLAAVTSDGFMIITITYTFLKTNVDKNAKMTLSCGDRYSVDHQLIFAATDSATFTHSDVVTLPVASGDTVSVTTGDSWNLAGNSTVQVQYVFVPFGTNN